LLRELLTSTGVNKWSWETGMEERLSSMEGARSRRPNLMGDLIGDWREELLTTAPDGRSLRLYTTTIPTEHRLHTLLHDPQYRLGIAWQNVVYNKPPHPSFFLGNGMTPPPSPNIRLIGNGEAIMAYRGAALPAQVETPMTDPNGGGSSRTKARSR
jgi:rhamnogalacturonan endolyase